MTINDTTQLLSRGASVKLLVDMLKQATEDKARLTKEIARLNAAIKEAN